MGRKRVQERVIYKNIEFGHFLALKQLKSPEACGTKQGCEACSSRGTAPGWEAFYSPWHKSGSRWLPPAVVLGEESRRLLSYLGHPHPD